MVRAIQGVAVIGVVVFAGLWLALMVMPKELERSAVGFVKAQITADIQERYPALGPDGLKAGLEKMSKKLGVQSAQLDAGLRSDLPELVAAIVSEVCGCEKTSEQDIAASIRSGLQVQIANLGLKQTKIAELIKGRYESIIAALRLDLLIFLGTNAMAFLGVLTVTLAPVQKKPLVIYPAVILIAAVMISTSIYAFSTDCFYAILFQNYWGYGYAALMMVIFGFLLDIVLNRARVTLNIVSALPNGLVPVC